MRTYESDNLLSGARRQKFAIHTRDGSPSPRSYYVTLSRPQGYILLSEGRFSYSANLVCGALGTVEEEIHGTATIIAEARFRNGTGSGAAGRASRPRILGQESELLP